MKAPSRGGYITPSKERDIQEALNITKEVNTRRKAYKVRVIEGIRFTKDFIEGQMTTRNIWEDTQTS